MVSKRKKEAKKKTPTCKPEWKQKKCRRNKHAKAKATRPLADAAAAPAEGAKRSRKQKAPVKRVEGPVESLVQNAAPWDRGASHCTPSAGVGGGRYRGPRRRGGDPRAEDDRKAYSRSRGGDGM